MPAPITPIGPRRPKASRSLAILTTVAAAVALLLGAIGLLRTTPSFESNAAAPTATTSARTQPEVARGGGGGAAANDSAAKAPPPAAAPAPATTVTQPGPIQPSPGQASTTRAGQPDLGVLTTSAQLREAVRTSLPSAGRSTISTSPVVNSCQTRSVNEASVPAERLRLTASAVWQGRPAGVYVYEATTTPNLYIIDVRATANCEQLVSETA